MIVLILTFITIFALCLGLTFLFYWIPKNFGYNKIGIILSSSVGLFFIFLTISSVFEDELFSKRDAEKLLKEQNITLNEDFKILKNESMSSIGDYYHKFTLNISNKDKHNVILSIKSAKNFISKPDSLIEITKTTDRYSGNKQTQNYETETQFIAKLFRPEGKGYAPTYHKISVDKYENILEFEDIDE